VLAVILGVVLGSLIRRVAGVQAVSVGEVCVMTAFFVLTFLIVLGGFAVVV